MSGHSPIREDKTCLNCRHVVAERYCPNCGQENTDSRKTFHHLFIHFFEDLTHYENAFWKTIRHLLFKPGRLTKEYLSGKRLSYLAPVRLYIFISFVTFLAISLMSNFEEEEEHDEEHIEKVAEKKPEAESAQKQKDTIATSAGRLARVNGELRFVPEDSLDIAAIVADSLHLDSLDIKVEKDGITRNPRDLQGFGVFKTVKELDSLQATRPEGQKLSWARYQLEKFMATMSEKSEEDHFTSKLMEAFIHNIPKALFLYMPIFAFWLWIFHGKKRWYYFDHGIFTLHYFSFMLLTLLIMMCLNTVVDWMGSETLSEGMALLWIILCGWWFFYFFRSHSRFYGESKAISRLKSLALYFINMWLITFFTMGLLIYTVLYMH